MSLAQRAATALTIAGALATAALALAQDQSQTQAQATRGARERSASARLAPYPVPSYRRSVVHHNPYPYPSYYQNDSTAGFRNPGGRGRYSEYYPAGNQFQLGQERDPVRVAGFDQRGGAPDRAEQLQAQSLGIAKYNSVQSHIDNYARPYFGYGYGIGAFGGFF